MSDYQMIWRGVENKRFEIDRIILEAHNIRVPDEFSVDFSEPRFPLTAQEEREQWGWEWDNNLSTTKDWLRKYNPDLSDEELDEKVAEIVPEKPEEVQQQTTLADILSS
jgi:hypothetical protein